MCLICVNFAVVKGFGYGYNARPYRCECSCISFTGHGCAISQASADIMADLITGETVEEARRLAELFLAMIRGEQLSEEDLEDLDEAAQLQDISHMPARVKCAELAWRTLDGMLTGQNNQ